MFAKLRALYTVLRLGESVADPALWKTRQITVTVLAGFVLALVNLARALGHELPIDQDAANALAGGLLAAVNVVLTLATSKTVGLPPDPGRPVARPAPDPAIPFPGP